jgi:hypothetical protein
MGLKSLSEGIDDELHKNDPKSAWNVLTMRQRVPSTQASTTFNTEARIWSAVVRAWISSLNMWFVGNGTAAGKIAAEQLAFGSALQQIRETHEQFVVNGVAPTERAQADNLSPESTPLRLCETVSLCGIFLTTAVCSSCSHCMMISRPPSGRPSVYCCT